MSQNVLLEARRLWQLCFPTDEASFLDFYFSQVAKCEDTYLHYNEAGQAVAHIGILRYTHGAYPELRLAYISGACTHPEYRQQGLMGRLMRRVIAEEQARGTDALILIPADEDLRHYYARHFGFVDTAPYLSLPWDLYHKLGLHQCPEAGMTAPTTSELLCKSVFGRQHIAYTQAEAVAIIEEYRLSEAYVLERWEGKQCRALMLARPSEEAIYIDALIANEEDSRSMLAELPQGKELLRNYLFIAPENMLPELSLYAKPWGMARPLNEAAQHIAWHRLGISLVHN